MADFREDLAKVESVLSGLVREVEHLPSELLAKLFYHKAVAVDAGAVTDAVNAARHPNNHVKKADIEKSGQGVDLGKASDAPANPLAKDVASVPPASSATPAAQPTPSSPPPSAPTKS